MATYECSKCGMSVNATCGKCNDQLVNDTLKLEDGSEVQISKCPNDHGKIKSPLCCGQDMVCSNAGLNYVSCSPYRVPVARLAAAQAEIRKKLN